MAITLDKTGSETQGPRMTSGGPALPDLRPTLARHRLAAEAATDPHISRALAKILDAGREDAAATIGDQLLEGVITWLATSGVTALDDQTPFLEALVDALLARDGMVSEISDDEIDGITDDSPSLDRTMPSSETHLDASPLKGPVTRSWFIPSRESADPIH